MSESSHSFILLPLMLGKVETFNKQCVVNSGEYSGEL